jgi:hypothetical protein
MAKFYQRYFPQPASTAIQYGYRGNNLIVNGQTYTAATNLEQVGNYQFNPACNDKGACIASMTVNCVFEPSYFANQYDLTGSRFSGEFAAGIFQSYNTWCDANNSFWTFKNLGCNAFTPYCVNTSTALSCTQGCVLSGSSASSCNAYGVPVITCSGSFFINANSCTNYYIVESPVGTFNCIHPMTQVNYGHGGYCSCLTYCGAVGPEVTFGDTSYSQYATNAGASGQILGPYGQGIGFQTTCYTPYNCSVSVYGVNNNAYASDSLFFGGTCCQYTFGAYCVGGGSGCYTSCASINGGYLNYACAAGTIEGGVRTFLTAKSPYQFYMLHNAATGGIHGVDISTSSQTTVRLSLRFFNQSAGTTTVLLNHKKGLPGLVIPSQADLETATAYRYYMINFNGADAWGTTTASQTISIFRTELNLTTGAITANINYALTMSTSTQAAIYANAGVNNTYVSQYNNPQFRRQTVNRIWYSVDAQGTRRLHMGVYNTNGTGFVTNGNGFANGSLQGAMFQIYSWSLNDVGFSATYLGAVNTAPYSPRYFCPLDVYWNTLYSGSSFGNDVTFTLNQTTGLYQYAATMNYIGTRLFQDVNGRWAVQVYDNTITGNGAVSNYIDFLSNTVGNTLVISASTTTFVYTGTTISGNILVNVFNYLGVRTSSTVALSIVGAATTPGMQFAGATYSTSVVCSTSTDTSVAISIVSAQSSKVVGTITSN